MDSVGKTRELVSSFEKRAQKQDLQLSRFCTPSRLPERIPQRILSFYYIIIRKTAYDKFRLQMRTDRTVFQLAQPRHPGIIIVSIISRVAAVYLYTECHYPTVDRPSCWPFAEIAVSRSLIIQATFWGQNGRTCQKDLKLLAAGFKSPNFLFDRRRRRDFFSDYTIIRLRCSVLTFF